MHPRSHPIPYSRRGIAGLCPTRIPRCHSSLLVPSTRCPAVTLELCSLWTQSSLGRQPSLSLVTRKHYGGALVLTGKDVSDLWHAGGREATSSSSVPGHCVSPPATAQPGPSGQPEQRTQR